MGMPEGFQPRQFLVGKGQLVSRHPLDLLRDNAALDAKASPPLRRSLPTVVVHHEEPIDIFDQIRQKDLKVTWDYAERAANDLRTSLREPYLDFFETASNADHPHAHEHPRRVERYMEQLLLEVRNIALPTYLIQAAALFPYLHDADQLNTEQRNLDTEESLPPKHAHGLAAGIQILAQTEEYARAAHISITEARRVTGAAAYMMIKHEEPAMLLKALAGERDPNDVDEKELSARYEANELDLTKITPAQLIKILSEQKTEKGFVAVDTPKGLHPIFEVAYKNELDALADDNTPLIPDYNREVDGSGLQFLTQVAVLADVFDMIMPAEESITRKLGVHKSLVRPFFRPEHDLELFKQQITGESGHWEPEEGSDLVRACWEFLHPLGGIDGELAQSPYVKELLAEAVIKGALSFRKVGLAMMDGDFAPLEQIFNRRIRSLAEKMLGKAKGEYVSLMESTEEEIVELLNDAELPQDRILSLIKERSRLVSKLTPKFRQGDGSFIYVNANKDEREEFKNRIDIVIQLLQGQYGITDEGLQKMENELVNGTSSMLPFSTYDSSVTRRDLPNRRRTINQH